MDTDDLTENAYDILRYAHGMNEFLWVEFGSMCLSYNNEDEYLKGLLKYTIDIKNNPDEFAESWNLEEHIKTKDLLEIEEKIRSVLSIPIEKRQECIFSGDDYIEDDIDDMFPSTEGMCHGCDLNLPLNDVGFCSECAEKLERDLIRNRDWDYSVSGSHLPKSRREGLREKVIKSYGEKLELIASDKPEKNNQKVKKRIGQKNKKSR